ncbi:MAG TPA: 3-deoxy-manno-octulosonate cytidylyltransferase [Gemmataceae bacterium]|jgi:3-deoxy-manno-octulosonate cytidylyltransferase (CMP-KDO synthetase)|nr:3-deoxy-manno-octulosonate cytidylyltransferase [Gemmataceae bacterium]
MRAAIVIPARYAATRLPGKPLLRSTGKYLVQHVYERACAARKYDTVLIATDDSRIMAAAESFGGKCVMTRRDHLSGTDRVAEVASNLDADMVVNLQGDEPQTDPAALDQLPDLLVRDPDAVMATLAAPITAEDIYRDPNCVKVVRDGGGRAIYFSRSPIPHVRDGRPDFAAKPLRFFQHIGVYAYRREFLLQLATQPPSPLEECEKLEQLRVLNMGRAIQVGIVAQATRGVDTFEDYQRFVAAHSAPPMQPARAA